MSVLRISPRAPASLGRRCARCFSSSPSSRSDQPSTDILDVLPGARSPAKKHPSSPGSQQSGRFSPISFARKALPAKVPKGMSEQMQEFAKAEDYTKQMWRPWKSGDVYAPHDLSGAEQKKWKMSRTAPQTDAFDVLGINPINEYKNYTMMSEFMTEMGRIKHSKLTGLRPVNQRKIAKAIRRAIGLGLMPSVHRHPLVVKYSSPTRFIA